TIPVAGVDRLGCPGSTSDRPWSDRLDLRWRGHVLPRQPRRVGLPSRSLFREEPPMTPTTLDDRSLGWLRYLHRKATTPDDWSQAGHPHPHWDNYTGPPMLSWHRFDLIDSSYGVALMADITPAWREVYART